MTIVYITDHIQRKLYALEMRMCGSTYVEIGKTLGVSETLAKGLVHEGARRMQLQLRKTRFSIESGAAN